MFLYINNNCGIVPRYVFLQYAEYEKVVIEDRVEKERARRQAEQEAQEIKSAIEVSALQYLKCSNRAGYIELVNKDDDDDDDVLMMMM